jgi:hypothetical protein
MVEEAGILVEPVKRGNFQNFRDYLGGHTRFLSMVQGKECSLLMGHGLEQKV